MIKNIKKIIATQLIISILVFVWSTPTYAFNQQTIVEINFSNSLINKYNQTMYFLDVDNEVEINHPLLNGNNSIESQEELGQEEVDEEEVNEEEVNEEEAILEKEESEFIEDSDIEWFYEFGEDYIEIIEPSYDITEVEKNPVTKLEKTEKEQDEIWEDSFESISEEFFIAMDEDGNVSYIPIEEVETFVEEEIEEIAIELEHYMEPQVIASLINEEPASISEEPVSINEDISLMSNEDIALLSNNITYGVVVFNNRNGTTNTTYTDAETGASGYTNGLYGPDAAYLGTQDGKVKFKLSGVIGLVNASDVSIIEYDDFINSGNITSSYKVTNGRIYHQITTNLKSYASTQHFGYMPNYMENDKTYYSYDGHYFYNSYKDMVRDYNDNTYINSINPSSPYYNYYMYLSHRSTTGFSESVLDDYLKSKTSNESSKMLNTGSEFIKAQNSYGANAGLMFGLAINESAYGSSNIAQSKNNLFGHGAVDSNPYYGANGYSSVADCITYHAEYFVSRQYLDIQGDARSFGPHLGNKRSGMNIKYASDPYWGEKAAAHGFLIEDFSTDTEVDYNKKQIGIMDGGNTPVYNCMDGNVLYYAKNKSYNNTYNMPVIVLDELIQNETLWYKIQSDMPIANDMQSVIFSDIYNMDHHHLFVKASDVNLVNVVTPENNGDTSPESTESYMLGDVSGDSKITSLDYIMVKNHIMGSSILTGNYLLAADTSKDGNVTSLDYIQIKNHIMGVSTIHN